MIWKGFELLRNYIVRLRIEHEINHNAISDDDLPKQPETTVAEAQPTLLYGAIIGTASDGCHYATKGNARREQRLAKSRRNIRLHLKQYIK